MIKQPNQNILALFYLPIFHPKKRKVNIQNDRKEFRKLLPIASILYKLKSNF